MTWKLGVVSVGATAALVPALAQAQPSGYQSAIASEYVGAWETSQNVLGGHRLLWSYVVISADGRIGWLRSEGQIADATESRLSEMLNKGSASGVTISGWKPVSLSTGRIDVSGGMDTGGQSFLVLNKKSNNSPTEEISLGQIFRFPTDQNSSAGPPHVPPLILIDYHRLPH
jgi:hypothetical protein